MKAIKRRLKKASGYTMIELVLSITLVAIGIIPIYQMVVGGARIQRVAEKTYQATLSSQALLQSISKQIEKDLGEEYKISRGLLSGDVKPWLKLEASKSPYLLTDFLETNQEQDYLQDFFKRFSYEVYIWNIKPSLGENKPILILSNALCPELGLKEKDPWEKIKVEIEEAMKIYFINKEALLWPSLATIKRPIAVGEVSYSHGDTIKIRANGIKGENIQVDNIQLYEGFNNKVKLLYKKYAEHLKGEPVITHRLTIEDHINQLEEDDVIALSVDLTTFPEHTKSKIIRVENKTKATLAMPIYNEKNLENIRINPVQQNNVGGNIIVENREKLEPGKNFIIGIIIKDNQKILSKIVDIYSYDYNKR